MLGPVSSARTRGRPRSSGRTLTPDAVVAAALALGDAEGLDAVTLAGVARELGCHVTSLYTHVDSLQDLLIRMALVTQSELADELWQAALGRSRSDALRALADVYRRFGEARPQQVRLLFSGAVVDDPRFTEGATRLSEPLWATLRSFGLEGDQVLHAHRAFSATIRGFVLGESGGTLPQAEADETFRQIVELFVGALESGAWPVPPTAADPGGTPAEPARRARRTQKGSS